LGTPFIDAGAGLAAKLATRLATRLVTRLVTRLASFPDGSFFDYRAGWTIMGTTIGWATK
jgi:hypothetical protein